MHGSPLSTENHELGKYGTLTGALRLGSCKAELFAITLGGNTRYFSVEDMVDATYPRPPSYMLERMLGQTTPPQPSAPSLSFWYVNMQKDPVQVELLMDPSKNIRKVTRMPNELWTDVLKAIDTETNQVQNGEWTAKVHKKLTWNANVPNAESGQQPIAVISLKVEPSFR